MVIRATATALNLSGTAGELADISDALASLGIGGHCRFAADLLADPTPYDRTLSAFEAVAKEGPVKLILLGETLRAEGAPEMLAKLASFFDFSEADRPGAHTHHEYWDGNEYVAADSRPLVVSLDGVDPRNPPDAARKHG